MSKRRRINKRPRLTKNKIMKLLSPHREWLKDTRGQELASPQDMVYFKVISVGGCISCYKGVLDDEGAAAETLGDTTSKQLQYRFTNYELRTHFRNVSNHDCFLEVYACVARVNSFRDSADNSVTDTDDRAMHKLVDGWDYKTADTRVNNAGTGTEVVYTAGGKDCTTYSSLLTPFQSKAFTQSYKIENVWSVKMKPGDDLFVKQNCPAFTYDSLKHDSGFNDASQTQQEDVGKVTKFLLVKLRGCLGKGNADDTKTGYLSTDIAWESLVKIKLRKMNRDNDLMALESTTRDNLLGVTLEGPTDYDMKDEDL